MNKSEKASMSVLKVLVIAILLMVITGFAVMANDTKIKNVKIVLSNNHEINVLTTKTKVGEILQENNISILPEEIVQPDIESDLTQENKIKITKETQPQLAVIEQEQIEINLEKILEQYQEIVEKIVVVEEKIPFETITKDNSNGTTHVKNTILQQGEEGIKKVTYKIEYQNEVEVSKEVISEEIIKEPVNKIVQIQINSITTSRGDTSLATAAARESSNALAQKVEGKTPIVKTMNTSAYAAETCGKSPSSPGYGRTSSGAKAQVWYTVAAGSQYKMGTIIYIPYFKNKPNGGWFVVQDRGGAISNNHIDIFMSSQKECIQFGRRNLDCYIYEI